MVSLANIFWLQAHNPVEGLEAEHILTAIRNASGTRPALFIPEISFEYLAKKQIARLCDPGIARRKGVREKERKGEIEGDCRY